MSAFLPYVLVAVGGGIGACFRHAVGQVTMRLLGPGFPYGTFTVNVVGGLLMGLLIGWLAQRSMPQEVRLFFAVGLLGGFTTFSSFALDSVTLFERGDLAGLCLYILGSVSLSILAVFVGLFISRALGA
ncbi:MAG: fluoride efflux transporter CrcB [Sphingomonadales bacterium]